MRELNELFIEVTNRCLQKCVHCSSAASCESIEEISFINIKKMVDAALTRGLRSVTLSGGEPFLHKNFASIVDYLCEKKIDVSIYTCGVYFNGNGSVTSIPKDVLMYISRKKVKRLIFSMHAATSETYSKITGTSSTYELAKKSIESSINAGLNIELHIVPMKINFHEIEDILKFASKKGISKVSLLRFVPQGRGALISDRLMLDHKYNELLKVLVKDWSRTYPAVSIRLGVPYNCLTMQGKKCTAAHDKLLINATGEIFPCEAFKYLKGSRPSIYKKN